MPENTTYSINEMWDDLSLKNRKRFYQETQIAKSTWYDWLKDPGKMPLHSAITICQWFAIENPRDLVTPLKF